MFSCLFAYLYKAKSATRSLKRRALARYHPFHFWPHLLSTNLLKSIQQNTFKLRAVYFDLTVWQKLRFEFSIWHSHWKQPNHAGQHRWLQPRGHLYFHIPLLCKQQSTLTVVTWNFLNLTEIISNYIKHISKNTNTLRKSSFIRYYSSCL